MAIAGLNIPLDSREGMDKITTTEKVTTPYFAGGYTELTASNIGTSSGLTATNNTYFYGISNTNTLSTEEFHVSFGSTNGYGAITTTNKKNVNDAIYKHFASLLLTPTEVTGGFFISSPASDSAVATGRDTEIYVLSAKRSNMKDRLNKGNWTIALSGSLAHSSSLDPVTGQTASANMNALGGATMLHLTDDSKNDNPTATPVGDRYNIVSGALGTISKESTEKNYGFYYPNIGVMVFSAAELSASIPGSGSQRTSTTEFGGVGRADSHRGDLFRGLGYPTDSADTVDRKVALRFVNCLQPIGSKLSFRDEEDQVSAQYFCRVRSGQANFSNNPTFVSGSNNELRQSKMRGYPNTFISSVQLYNSTGDMVAVGNLSTPLKKNFSSEATIKVKLTY